MNSFHSNTPDPRFWNEDLAPVPAEKRTWTWWNVAALWIGMAVCITTYTLAASLIDLSTQQRKEPRGAVHLIQDDQPVAMRLKVQLGLVELGTVALGLQVQVEVGPALGHFQRQGCLAHLPRAEQGHGGCVVELLGQQWQKISLKHPCNYGVSIPDLQG